MMKIIMFLQKWWIVIASLTIAGSILSSIQASAEDLARETFRESPFNPGTAQSIAKQVLKRKLVPDKFGCIDLPPQPDFSTTCDVVTITRLKDGQRFIYFPTRCARFGARGYLYAEKAIKASDIAKKENGISFVRVHDERARWTSGPEASSISVPLSAQLNRHWWRVEETTLDP